MHCVISSGVLKQIYWTSYTFIPDSRFANLNMLFLLVGKCLLKICKFTSHRYHKLTLMQTGYTNVWAKVKVYSQGMKSSTWHIIQIQNTNTLKFGGLCRNIFVIKFNDGQFNEYTRNKTYCEIRIVVIANVYGAEGVILLWSSMVAMQFFLTGNLQPNAYYHEMYCKNKHVNLCSSKGVAKICQY